MTCEDDDIYQGHHPNLMIDYEIDNEDDDVEDLDSLIERRQQEEVKDDNYNNGTEIDSEMGQDSFFDWEAREQQRRRRRQQQQYQQELVELVVPSVATARAAGTGPGARVTTGPSSNLKDETATITTATTSTINSDPTVRTDTTNSTATSTTSNDANSGILNVIANWQTQRRRQRQHPIGGEPDSLEEREEKQPSNGKNRNISSSPNGEQPQRGETVPRATVAAATDLMKDQGTTTTETTSANTAATGTVDDNCSTGTTATTTTTTPTTTATTTMTTNVDDRGGVLDGITNWQMQRRRQEPQLEEEQPFDAKEFKQAATSSTIINNNDSDGVIDGITSWQKQRRQLQGQQQEGTPTSDEKEFKQATGRRIMEQRAEAITSNGMESNNLKQPTTPYMISRSLHSNDVNNDSDANCTLNTTINDRSKSPKFASKRAATSAMIDEDFKSAIMLKPTPSTYTRQRHQPDGQEVNEIVKGKTSTESATAATTRDNLFDTKLRKTYTLDGNVVVHEKVTAENKAIDDVLHETDKEDSEQQQGIVQKRVSQPGAFAMPGILLTHQSSSIRSFSLDDDCNDDGDNSADYIPQQKKEDRWSATGETLVEASQVLDTETSVVVPAREYDPDAIPPWYKNRRMQVYGTFVIAVIVGYLIVLLITQHALHDEEKEEIGESPTSPPTSYRELLGLQEQIEMVIPAEQLYDPTSSYYIALQWIIHDDPLQLQPDDPLLIQRYILVYLYFATTQNGKNLWKYCNPPSSPTGDIVCVDPWTRSIRWLVGEHECMWYGIWCNALNQTTTIILDRQGLTGTLPCELVLLSRLESIYFNDNLLSGTLCPEFASLNLIRMLRLDFNELTGPIPPSWWKSKSLEQLHVQNNYLTGTIPTQLGRAKTLNSLELAENLLTGPLPTELGLLTRLFFLSLSKNLFHGRLPQEIGKVKDCTHLWMNGNDLSGPLPSGILALTKLRALHLQSTQLNGEVPLELWQLNKLVWLDLSNTKLSGTIGTEIGHMASLSVLHLHHAGFHGTIPTELGLLTKLQEITLQGNSFVASIPSELCELRGPYTIQTLTADCSPLESTGQAAIGCQTGCCTTCCEADTGECLDK